MFNCLLAYYKFCSIRHNIWSSKLCLGCQILPLSDAKRRCLCSLFISVSLICGVYLIGSAWLKKDLLRVCRNPTSTYSLIFPMNKVAEFMKFRLWSFSILAFICRHLSTIRLFLIYSEIVTYAFEGTFTAHGSQYHKGEYTPQKMQCLSFLLFIYFLLWFFFFLTLVLGYLS